MDINTHVYCTNCVNGKELLCYIENDIQIEPMACVGCNPLEPEDSMTFGERPNYVMKNLKYIEVTSKELTDIVINNIENDIFFDYTFYEEYDIEEIRYKDDYNYDCATGANGIKALNIFDECVDSKVGLIAIGYWMGGRTTVEDISNGYNYDEIFNLINNYFKSYIEKEKVLLIL